MSAPVHVISLTSNRVHAAIERDASGQYLPLCGIKSWNVLSTDAPINCRRCLKAIAAT